MRDMHKLNRLLPYRTFFLILIIRICTYLFACPFPPKKVCNQPVFETPPLREEFKE